MNRVYRATGEIDQFRDQVTDKCAETIHESEARYAITKDASYVFYGAGWLLSLVGRLLSPETADSDEKSLEEV